MRTIKILSNQNKLCSETTTDSFHTEYADDFSMRFSLNGSQQCRVNGRDLAVHSGNFLVVNKGSDYSRSIYSDVPCETFAVWFANGFLTSFHSTFTESQSRLLESGINLKTASPSFMESIYPLKGHIMFNLMHLKQHFNNQHTEEFLINDYIYHCLLLFYQLYNKEVVNKSMCLKNASATIRLEIFRRLTVAKDYILSNYNLGISLEDISSSACMSPPHLFRTFKQVFNCSPHQFLIKVRLENAQHLLLNTRYTVHEIVDMVGLNCVSTFIKMFKQEFGYTPRKFRIADPVRDNDRRLF